MIKFWNGDGAVINRGYGLSKDSSQYSFPQGLSIKDWFYDYACLYGSIMERVYESGSTVPQVYGLNTICECCFDIATFKDSFTYNQIDAGTPLTNMLVEKYYQLNDKMQWTGKTKVMVNYAKVLDNGFNDQLRYIKTRQISELATSWVPIAIAKQSTMNVVVYARIYTNPTTMGQNVQTKAQPANTEVHMFDEMAKMNNNLIRSEDVDVMMLPHVINTTKKEIDQIKIDQVNYMRR